MFVFACFEKESFFVVSRNDFTENLRKKGHNSLSSEIFREVNAGEVQLLSYAIIINCSLINYFRIMKKSQHHQPNKKK